MKVAAQVLLIILFVILFLVGLLAGTFKFQLLDYNFWQGTFEKHNVYQNLAAASKNSLESQVGAGGGSKNDARVLTDLITSANVKDFVDKNLQNILSFVNGKTPQIIVYLPVKIIPRSLLPNNLIGIQSDIPLKDLLTKFNYQNYQSLPLQSLGRLGRLTALVFMGSVSLLVVIMILLVFLVRDGDRFVAPGIAVFLSGVITLFLSGVGGRLEVVPPGSLPGNSSFIKILAGNLIPPLLTELMKTWSVVGIVFVATGLVLFFVRRSRYNTKR
jgi:hypothetical protein